MTETEIPEAWGERLFNTRPGEMRGETRKIETSVGTLYVTVNFHEGRPVEVLATLGKSGMSERAMTEAIGRLASTALQYGTPLGALCKQLRGISSSDPLGFGPNKVLSVPDGIAQVLELYEEEG